MNDQTPAADAIRVLIVDDEPPARERLGRMLADVPAVTVVGEAGNGADAIAAAFPCTCSMQDRTQASNAWAVPIPFGSARLAAFVGPGTVSPRASLLRVCGVSMS